MALSLVMLLGPVLLLFLLYQWVSGGATPARVDQGPAVHSAQVAGLPATAPEGLSHGWVPVSAAFQEVEGGLTLRLGYITPEGESVQVVQSSVDVATLLEAELGEQARPDGQALLANHTWQLYRDVRGGPERALVRREPDRTTIVVGAASSAELRLLAAATP